MTTRQKSLTWVIGLVIAYFIAAFPFHWPPFPRPMTTTTVNLSGSSGSCDANPREPEVWPKDGDQIYYYADSNGPYKLDFGTDYPYYEGPNPITVPSNQKVGPFTAKPVPSTTTDLYKLSNSSNCKQASQYIGVIIKH